jgi:hypothetical protein
MGTTAEARWHTKAMRTMRGHYERAPVNAGPLASQAPSYFRGDYARPLAAQPYCTCLAGLVRRRRHNSIRKRTPGEILLAALKTPEHEQCEKIFRALKVCCRRLVGWCACVCATRGRTRQGPEVVTLGDDQTALGRQEEAVQAYGLWRLGGRIPNLICAFRQQAGAVANCAPSGAQATAACTLAS